AVRGRQGADGGGRRGRRGRAADRRPRRLAGLRRDRDPFHAVVPADAVTDRLRHLPVHPRRGRTDRLARALSVAPMEVMKQLRQRQIRDLVAQRPVRTQLELAAALRERGFRTTQATISRDVAELGLLNVTRDVTTAYALPPRLIEAETSGEDRLKKLLSDLPLEIHEAGL